MLERFFGGCDGGFFGMGWWIIVLFFLFLAFQDSWTDISDVQVGCFVTTEFP